MRQPRSLRGRVSRGLHAGPTCRLLAHLEVAMLSCIEITGLWHNGGQPFDARAV